MYQLAGLFQKDGNGVSGLGNSNTELKAHTKLKLRLNTYVEQDAKLRCEENEPVDRKSSREEEQDKAEEPRTSKVFNLLDKQDNGKKPARTSVDVDIVDDSFEDRRPTE